MQKLALFLMEHVLLKGSSQLIPIYIYIYIYLILINVIVFLEQEQGPTNSSYSTKKFLSAWNLIVVHKRSISDVCKLYGIPEPALQKLALQHNNKVQWNLKKFQENFIVSWFVDCTSKNITVNKNRLALAIKFVLDKTGEFFFGKSNFPTNLWLDCFLLKHPQLDVSDKEFPLDYSESCKGMYTVELSTVKLITIKGVF